jgi:hypothetical protein
MSTSVTIITIDKKLVNSVVYTSKHSIQCEELESIIKQVDALKMLYDYNNIYESTKDLVNRTKSLGVFEGESLPPPYVEDVYNETADELIQRYHKLHKDYDYDKAYMQYRCYKALKGMKKVKAPDHYDYSISEDIRYATIQIEALEWQLLSKDREHKFEKEWEAYLISIEETE